MKSYRVWVGDSKEYTDVKSKNAWSVAQRFFGKSKDLDIKWSGDTGVSTYKRQRARENIFKMKPQERYDLKNTVQVHLKLNLKTDADILAKLKAVPSKQGYIKELIREDIKPPD